MKKKVKFDTDTLEHRMYFVVMRHLSGIQKGIQAGHAAVEYAMKHGDSKEFKRWFMYDKTFVLLECNSTSSSQNTGRLNQGPGELETLQIELTKLGVNVIDFYEPDLAGLQTAICFVLDERVFGKDPMFTGPPNKEMIESTFGGIVEYDKAIKLRNLVMGLRLASN